MRAPGLWLRSLVGGLIAFGVGCILNLNGDMACGDGYLDHAAGEECDPLVSASFDGACAAIGFELGVAACDPTSCTIDASPAQCAVCGDGNVTDGEDCDGDNLNGEVCQLGGVLRCIGCQFDRSLCETCGNGSVDDGEECDPVAVTGGIVDPRTCVGLEPLSKPYSSGRVTVCKDNCEWQRTQCGYCGDDELDGAELVDGDIEGILSKPEVCDGVAHPDPAALQAHCSAVCGSVLDLECAFGCADDCRSFDLETIAPADLGCCRTQGEACPLSGEQYDCCWLLDNPGQEGFECEEQINDGNLLRFCK